MKKVLNEFRWEISISLLGACFMLLMVFLAGALLKSASVEGGSLGAQVLGSEQKKEKVLSLGTVISPDFMPPQEGKAIRVDLDEMKLYLYENGQVVKEFDVLAKGKVGSYWETPGGEYKVLLKKVNHFSSTGKVWLPYSIQFFGNYFIHGWPYFPDGTPVPKGFSGGCIRLSVEDMREVYNWSERGTYIYVHGVEKSSTQSEGKYYERELSPKLELSAESYLVGDIDTGEIILGEKINKILPATGLTKLVTAFAELGIVNQQNNATILNTGNSESKLKTGQKILIAELVYPLMMESDDVAAEVIAMQIGRNYFVSQMNETAKSLGLSSTVFVDPTGRSEENLSTTRDAFKLGVNLKNYKYFLFSITQKKAHISEGLTWRNNNPFIDKEGFKGGVVDDYSALLVFKIPIDGSEGRNLAVVLLGSKDVESDVSKILNHLNRNVYFK